MTDLDRDSFVSAFIDEAEAGSKITVCQGPPACLLKDDDAVNAQIAGCPWCKVITLHEDGSETVKEPIRA